MKIKIVVTLSIVLGFVAATFASDKRHNYQRCVVRGYAREKPKRAINRNRATDNYLRGAFYVTSKINVHDSHRKRALKEENERLKREIAVIEWKREYYENKTAEEETRARELTDKLLTLRQKAKLSVACCVTNKLSE